MSVIECLKSIRGRPFGLWAVLTLAAIGIMPQPGLSQESCNLVAGYGEEAPYHFTNPAGKIVGIDADFLRTVLDEIGCSLTFEELPWKRTLQQVRAGGIDVTLGASLKEERTKFAHYSIPYRGQPHVVFEKKPARSQAKDLQSFLENGYSLGVVLGWHYTDDIQKLLKNPDYKSQIQTAPNFDSALAMSTHDRFDGLLANPSQVANAIGKEKLRSTYQMIRADIDVLHFIFSRKSVPGGLVEKFNKRAAELINEGYFVRNCRQYEEMLVSTCSLLSTKKP